MEQARRVFQSQSLGGVRFDHLARIQAYGWGMIGIAALAGYAIKLGAPCGSVCFAVSFRPHLPYIAIQQRVAAMDRRKD
jgi:hypothetical protein